MTDDGAAIKAEGLTKKLGDTLAVNGLSFDVPRGSVFGLLGRNGAGKTTAIRLLLGLLSPDAGRSSVFGEDSLRLSRGTRQRIGYLSEKKFPYDDLPIRPLLRFVSAFFEAWDWEKTADLLGRFDVPQDRPLSEMSAGERRKAELLVVLAQSPDLLILDDPAVGLDVTVRREFLWAALEVARDEGKTVLFTSHVLTDVERVADTVAILNHGAVRVLAPLDDLKARTKRLVIELPDGARAEGVVVPGEVSREARGRELSVVTGACSAELEARLRAELGSLEVEDLNLEDIFCAVVGGGPARDERAEEE